MKQVSVPIISNSEVMAGVNALWLEAPEIAAEAKPGQFVMVKCGDGTLLRRPISIHQVNKKSRLALLVREAGKGTHWLRQVRVGDKLDIFGPLGNSFTIKDNTKTLLLVAGGIGIAPLAFLAQEGLRLGLSVKMLLGAASAKHLYPARYLPTMQELSITTEDGSTGSKGFVIDLLPDYHYRADQIYVCGPLPMYKAMVEKYGKLLKEKPAQVSLELRMGCGLGVCYSCTVKTQQGLKQVCTDGPVFEMQDVLWEEMGEV